MRISLLLSTLLLISCINNKNAMLFGFSDIQSASVDLDPIDLSAILGPNNFTGTCAPENSTVTVKCDAGVSSAVNCVNGKFIATNVLINSIPVTCEAYISLNDTTVVDEEDAVLSPPIISNISDQTTDEDMNKIINFMISDSDGVLNCLSSMNFSGQDPLKVQSITFSGVAPNCSATIVPIGDAFGSDSMIVFTLTDSDGRSVADDFDLIINPINDIPNIATIADQSTTEDIARSINFVISDIDSTINCSNVSIQGSSNATLIPTANIVISGAGTNCTVTMTPLNNQSGFSDITLRLTDIGTPIPAETFDELFRLTVTSVDDPPVISNILNQSTEENTNKVVSFTINDVDSVLNCTTSMSTSGVDAGLIQSIVFSGTAPNCIATISPVANATGIDSAVTFIVSDASQSVNDSFDFEILACPDSTISLNFNVVASDLTGLVRVDSNDDPLSINWGDGSPAEPINGSLIHAYASVGPNTVTITGCMKDITSFDLYQGPSNTDSYFSGGLPNLSGMTNLGFLNLGYNELSGSLTASSFANNTLLFNLRLNNNQFTGALPTGVFDNNPLLQYISLSNNKFSGTLPAGIFDNNTVLSALYFNNNQFSGALPAGVFDNNPGLLFLIFNTNQFNGALPAGIFDNNTALKYLNFHTNQFSGVLPSGIFDNNTSLIQLYFNSNQFSGALTSTIFDNLASVVNLVFSDNQFSGLLPSGIFDNIISVKTLSLNSNLFTGALPVGVFDNIIDAININIYGNDFTTSASLINNNKLTAFTASSNQFDINSINSFLVDLDTSGAPGSTSSAAGYKLENQSPLAPPSGGGLTAKNNMVGAGLFVTTD